jgi:hypothetical protein
MAVLTAPDEPNVTATRSPATPALRVRRRGEGQDRTVPLTAGKCTIGSSPQCQVCLPSSEVRPLQCLITLELNVATVTRWAAGVRLNGQEFSKAKLQDGDRLTIGDWELAFERGVSALDEELAAFDDEELSVEAPLELSPEVTPDNLLEGDELADEAPEEIPAPPTALAMVDWPIAQEVATVVAEETPAVESATPIELTPTAPASCLSSQAFADSLVLQLWTANDRARRRAKLLITGLRAARFQADALMADLSAIEGELDLARAAYDSHLGNDDRLQQELAKQHEERVTPLLEEIASLQLELEQAQASITRQTAAYEALSGEFAALQEAAKTPTVDPVLAKRAAELEAAVTAQSQELEQVASELRLAQQEQESLAERYQQEVDRLVQEAASAASEAERVKSLEVAATDRSGELEQLTDELRVAKQEQERLAELYKLEADRCAEETARAATEAERAEGLEAAAASHSQELERLTGELQLAQQEQERLTELHQLEAKRAAQFAQALLEQQSLIEAASVESDAVEEPVPVTDQASEVEDPWRHAMPAAEEPVAAPAPATAPMAFQSPEVETPPPVAEPPAPAFSTPSFIDKYRHLLETDDAPDQPAVAPKGSRPVIDDEFLSPAKAETGLSPADESDDVLEAYMANMMRRMRSTSPSYESSQAAASVNESLLASSGPSQRVESPAPAEFVPEEPFNIEDMKNATRKTPLASDLSALREMANTSARTAIAKHNQKQIRESAVTKVAIALTAAAASAYIMTSAPAIDAWQFWGGATTGVLGVGAAVQALLIERRTRVRAG